ncbi:hypothetical protein ROHU_025452 [Labeo rohita]|uniref:Uncharacterized protein n=1 Tax=Labeo rohita TaxID=84645 RepID=A0A498MKB8_LABRO|nr:hypothetical protein ROHU_025452 [Labeo rohita]
MKSSFAEHKPYISSVGALLPYSPRTSPTGFEGIAVMSGTSAAAQSQHPGDSPEIRFRGCPNQVHFTEPQRSTN